MKKRILLLLLCCVTVVSMLSFASSAVVFVYTDEEELINLTRLFEAKEFTSSTNYHLNYRIFLPQDYDPQKEYPLVLFLHGAGERGDDNESQLKNGISQPFRNKGSSIYQCIVLAPQCPSDKKWVNVENWTDCTYSTDEIAESDELKAVLELLAYVEETHSVDQDRVYATGLSMGGYATWDLSVRHTDLFAAVMPLCGGCDTSKAELLTNLPIKTFHGQLDTTVPPTGTVEMVAALQAAGSTKIEYTSFPIHQHNIWDTVYNDNENIEWLLSHKLSDRIPKQELPDTSVNEPVTQEVTAPHNAAAPATDEKSGCQSTVTATLPLITIAVSITFAVSKKKRK